MRMRNFREGIRNNISLTIIVLLLCVIIILLSSCEEINIEQSAIAKYEVSGKYYKYPRNPVAKFVAEVPNIKTFSDPSIIYEDNKYHMWFSCNNGKYSEICYAISSDGLKWKVRNSPVLRIGAPGSWDDYNSEVPSVIKDDSVYKMWYAGYSKAKPDIYSIGYATSSDGINWQRISKKDSPYKQEGLVFVRDETKEGEILTIADPSVLRINGTYHMWYNGFGTKPFKMIAISHATSSDGINWKRDPKNPVIMPSAPWEMIKKDEGAVNQPSVIWDGTKFEMWYGSFVDKYMRYSAISHAVSKDGTTWIKDKKPSLVPGPEHLWPSVSAVRVGEEIRLYYIGFSKLGMPTQLYLAISTR